MLGNVFLDVSIVMLLAAALALLAYIFKQPIIPAYIFAGLIIGPLLGVIDASNPIMGLSELGVAFLLFLIGLELDFRKVKSLGTTILVSGTLYTLIILAVAFPLALAVGLDPTTALYFAFLGVFSSTMIVVKTLSDEKQLETLHGKIAIGFLLLEDFFALMALSALTLAGDFSVIYLSVIVGKIALLLVISYFLAKYVFLPLFNFSSRSQELSFIIALSAAFFFGILYYYFGQMLLDLMLLLGVAVPADLAPLLAEHVSVAIGAFVAGITMAPSPYAYNIVGKIGPLRDFFLTIFFVTLGIGLEFSSLEGLLPLVLILLFIILFLKPFLVYHLLHIFGYTRRTGFYSSIHLSQLSEFGLILLAAGMASGHVDKSLFSAVIIVGIITITLSTYLMGFARQLYNFLEPVFDLTDHIPSRKIAREYLPKSFNKEVLLVGYDRIGLSIYDTLKKLRKDFLVVDYNPDVVENLIKKKIHCIYGDIMNPEIIEKVHLPKAKMVISTAPDFATNKYLVQATRDVNENAVVIVTSLYPEESLILYDMGADYVIVPHLLSGNHMSFLIEEFDSDFKHVTKHRNAHMKEIKRHLRHGAKKKV